MSQLDDTNSQLTEIIRSLEQSQKENRRWLVFWQVVAAIWLVICVSWLWLNV